MFKGFKVILMLMVSLAFVGCDDDDAVLPKVTAEFTQTVNQDNGVVTFINVSENADSFTWDFGDGTMSSETNPTKIYETGTYTVTLTAENVAGASDEFEDEINIQIPEEVTFPITFDNPLVNYEVTTFDGTAFSIVDNPDASGANDTVTGVGEIVNSGVTFEGISFDLGEPLDLSVDKSFSMKFWSQTPIDVLVKLEQGTGDDVENSASHGGTGWELIYFTLDSSSEYSRFTVFVDGPGTTAGTFYIDDIEQLNRDEVPCLETDLELPLDFDCEGIDYASKIVGNVSFTVVDNPEQSGINDTNTKVGQITNVGAEFENAFFDLDIPIDFSSQSGVRLKLFSNQALPILLKFENDDNDDEIEDVQMHTGSGWEELTFTLNSSATFNNMVLFVDGPGTATGTFYLDDVQQVDGTPPPPPFEDGLLTNGDFQTLDMNGNVTAWIQGVDDSNPAPSVTMGGDTYYSIDITDPDPQGNAFTINLSQKVEIIAEETYTLSFEAFTDAATASRSIIAGIGLSGTVNDDFTNVTETVAITSTPTRYEVTLTASGFGATDARVLFDLAAEAGQVNIDDVRLTIDSGGGSSGGGGCDGEAVAATSFPVDFEGCESFINTFSSAGDAGVLAELVDNPDPSNINDSDFVLKVTKTSGVNRWGGIQNTFPEGVIDITSQTFKIKVYSNRADVTYRFELALVPNPEPVVGNPAPQFRQVSGGANEWVELEFTFENLPASPTTYNQLVIKPGNPDGSDPEQTAEEEIYYFDDLRLD